MPRWLIPALGSGAAFLAGCVGRAVHADQGVDPIRVVYRPGSATEEYPDLRYHHNLMAKVLSFDLYRRYYKKETATGFTLDQAIQTGVDNVGRPDHVNIGCVAGDADAYELFAELYDQVIHLRHPRANLAERHPVDLYPGNIRGDGVLDSKYVIKCRVRVSRNLEGMRLLPSISRAERRDVEFAVRESCRRLTGEFQGAYTPLRKLSQKEINNAVSVGVGFDKPTSPWLLSAGIARDWPDARGFFTNSTASFLVWVNEQDHMRVIAQQKGGDLKACFARLSMGLGEIERHLRNVGKTFQWSVRLGFITHCPSNLGTAMSTTVNMKLPQLAKHPQFPALLQRLRMTAQESSVGGTLSISNADRMGLSEAAIVENMVRGLDKLIEYERMLEEGKTLPKYLL